ncbi:hypothetical protein K1T35_18755 [Pseudonocardia sp. DSM 110487]|uniref:hypothetical protein n=1 Tax=Pseudonocardia sp. DSM 110487 TaxID=2865833 RepID=UPI001C696FD5|nr:hypothetical protein [Pseudonocardia sp. DSM 110487]QYN39057.1 hypothetical protein K1T35_18755 [Pseudonocardia sp. DSM 110487]
MIYREPARAAARSLASSGHGAPTRLRTAPPGRLLAAVAMVALIGTACSTAPAATGSGGGQNSPAGATPSPAELQQLLTERRESAKCMRENGVEDFPDPDANGAILYYGDDPDMKSASEKCDTRSPEEREQNPGNGG